MVSKRQKLARKRYKAEHPELFPKPEPTPPKDPENSKKNKKKNKLKPKKRDLKGPKTLKNSGHQKPFKKHPLRVPGMRPGESCFICKAESHIAKFCPQKAQWEKNKICLHCRRRGHSLKNCPNRSEETEEKKLCYNCGESGHSLSKCPQPLQDGGTKFANCFICNERGHLSKNCPKNTHGIYPKGGCCKICGGVTHLAKDCPNKGNKISAKRMEDTHTGSESQERSKVIKFTSGDDLDDDFMGEGLDKSNKDSTTRSKDPSVSLAVENHVKPKKNQGPKVVNFVG